MISIIKHKTKKKIIDNSIIQSYIMVINNKNRNEIKILYSENNKYGKWFRKKIFYMKCIIKIN